MNSIREKKFACRDDLYHAVADVLVHHMSHHFGKPHAVMLSGGKTPLPIYEAVSHRRVSVADDFYVLYSDERMVPVASPESNYGNTVPMLTALGVEDAHVMRVPVELELKKAAEHYGSTLNRFLKIGGRITVGLLGLGVDGHTASLFSADDVKKGAGGLAVAVRRDEKPDRVSVTPDLLKRVETLIFLAVGADKRDAIAHLLKKPERYPAGMAVREARSVQIWTV